MEKRRVEKRRVEVEWLNLVLGENKKQNNFNQLIPLSYAKTQIISLVLARYVPIVIELVN